MVPSPVPFYHEAKYEEPKTKIEVLMIKMNSAKG